MWSDDEPIVLIGVQDLVVVRADGRILIMPTERAAEMKQLLDALPAEIRDIDAMSELYLLEPESPGPEWAPFAGVRPIAELRAGAWLVRERWEAAVDAATPRPSARTIEGFHEAGRGAGHGDRTHRADRRSSALRRSRRAGAGSTRARRRRFTHRGATVAWIPARATPGRGRHDRA